MDDRVYEVGVCAECLTQRVTFHDPCPVCGEGATETVRFRVSRDAVLKQADPHASLIERTVYFGCVGRAGHYYWNRDAKGRPYEKSRSGDNATPWGMQVDGGLIPRRHGLRLDEGIAHIVHEHGWTAVVFADYSVDSRPGSWSVYCIPDTLDGVQALEVAREAFPTIFARYTFPVRLAT